MQKKYCCFHEITIFGIFQPIIRQSCFYCSFHLFGIEYRPFIVSAHMNLWEEFLSKAVSDIAKKEANLVLLGISCLVFVILLGKSRQDCIGVMECMFSSTSHKELKSCDADVIHYSFIKISTSSRTNGKAGGLFSFLLIILDYNSIQFKHISLLSPFHP